MLRHLPLALFLARAKRVKTSKRIRVCPSFFSHLFPHLYLAVPHSAFSTASGCAFFNVKNVFLGFGARTWLFFCTKFFLTNLPNLPW